MPYLNEIHYPIVEVQRTLTFIDKIKNHNYRNIVTTIYSTVFIILIINLHTNRYVWYISSDSSNENNSFESRKRLDFHKHVGIKRKIKSNNDEIACAKIVLVHEIILTKKSNKSWIFMYLKATWISFFAMFLYSNLLSKRRDPPFLLDRCNIQLNASTTSSMFIEIKVPHFNQRVLFFASGFKFALVCEFLKRHHP